MKGIVNGVSVNILKHQYMNDCADNAASALNDTFLNDYDLQRPLYNDFLIVPAASL